MPAELARRVTEQDREILRSHQPCEFEHIVRTPEGTEQVRLVVKFPILDGARRIVGIGAQGQDITGRKRAEETAHRLQAELAHVARWAALSEMATGFAHEINQPLTAIGNFAAGARRRIWTKSVSEAEMDAVFERIVLESLRAGAIIRRIRRFVRKEGSEARPTDVNEAIQEALRLLAVEPGADSIPVETVLEADLPKVMAAPVRIQQAVFSLVRNAFEAMEGLPPERRLVVIETRRRADGGIEVSIADTGPGIPAELRDEVFDAFFTTKPGAAGMGLKVCRTIVEEHGGSLVLDPAPGGGTVARFTLPTPTADLADQDAA
jgi:C4-dicarboxylate-specific signal transduction histidine kinase